MAILVIIIFFLLTGLAFALLLFLTKIIRTGKKDIRTVESRNHQNGFFLLISLLIAALTTYFFLFTSPEMNYKNACLEQEKRGFKMTVKGRRPTMVHDPISVFLRKTYEDSMEYHIPRSEGVVKGEELLSDEGYYKSVGTITIEDDKMELNLFYNNYDDKKLEPDTWNGKYKLVWRKH